MPTSWMSLLATLGRHDDLLEWRLLACLSGGRRGLSLLRPGDARLAAEKQRTGRGPDDDSNERRLSGPHEHPPFSANRID